MASGKASTGEFFAKNDAYRKHPFINNHMRRAAPGLGTAVALFSIYLFVDGGAAIVNEVKKAVEVSRAKGAHVVWVVRQHDSSGRDVELFRKHLYADGIVGPTVKGSKGAELVEGLEPKAGEVLLIKSRFSAFFATNLDLILRRMAIRNVVVVGVQTPNCIRATVFDALALDYSRVIVLADATAAATPKVHEANLYDMRKVGVDAPTVDEWAGW